MLASPPSLGGHLVLDPEGRVIEWDEGLTSLLGVSRTEAIGRLCYQLIGGTDDAGRLICKRDCPVMLALREGRVTSSVALVIRSPLYGRMLMRCRLTALPSGGALVSVHPETRDADSWVDSFAGVAALATHLAVQALPQGFIEALTYLLNAVQANAAELFLVEPDAGSVSLACHVGEARQAFTQERVQFRAGEGFPGLTLVTGSLLISDDLVRETRFIRDSVKRGGFHQYVSAPIVGPSGRHGVVGLAFRDPKPETQLLTSLITSVCAVLGLRIEAARAQLSTEARACVARSSSPGELAGAVRSLLDHVVRFTDATDGELYLSAAGASVTRIAIGSIPVARCPLLGDGGFAVCPACAARRGIVVQGFCQQGLVSARPAREDAGLWCCAPIFNGTGILGLIRVRHPASARLLPSGTLLLLEEAAREVSQALRELDQRARARPALATATGNAIAGAGLRIRCLGSFELQVRDQVVTTATIVRKRVLTLLKILATFRGRYLPRDQLIEWLWPESDPDVKRTQFYVLVHELRRLLEPEGKRGHWTVVVTVDDRYALASSPAVVVDAEEFEQLLDAARQCEQAGDQQEAILTYERATALYRGDFLEDEPSAPWCVDRRAQLRRRYIDALRRLAVLYREARMWQRSTDVLLRALSLDHLDEELHRELMITYWASGRRDEAIRQYAACVRLLADELGITPSVETVKLALRIRAQTGSPPV